LNPLGRGSARLTPFDITVCGQLSFPIDGAVQGLVREADYRSRKRLPTWNGQIEGTDS